MSCYACRAEAHHQCRRCGKAYCDQHGTGPFCAGCLKPASLLPSPTLFRGALLALLVGSVIALWLLLRPPPLPGGEAGEKAAVPTATPAAFRATPPAAAVLPTPTVVSTPLPTPTPQPFLEYEVKAGDTLWAIAQRFDITMEAIAGANGFASLEQVLRPGQMLKIPRSSPGSSPTPTPR